MTQKLKHLSILIIVLCISIPFLVGYGQIQTSSENDIAELLKGENVSNFLVIQEERKFVSNFRDENKLLSAGNSVLIKSGIESVIDGESLPEFSTLLIEGTLRVLESNGFPLKVQKIIIGPSGKLIIGTNETPIENEAEIVFIKKQEGEIGIFVFGELTINGRDIGSSFVELLSDVKTGENNLVVDRSVKKWNKGDTIVITTSGLHRNDPCGFEESEIKSISGVFISLEEPLKCNHGANLKDSDFRTISHVSNLNRNVVIRSEDPDHRGSVNYFHGSTGSINFAEFSDLGPKGVLARYPIHFHHMGDSSIGIQVKGNSILNSENRWITIHDSNGIFVKNNVGYKSIGHGFFLEDGSEFENVFEENIGITSHPGSLTATDGRSSIFWISNPYNVYKNNVAVGAYYHGYYFSISNKWVEYSAMVDKVNLKSLPTLEFENNHSYNTRHSALKIERTLFENDNFDIGKYLISNLFVWNAGEKDPGPLNSGIFIVSDNVTVINSKIYDSVTGIFLSGDDNTISNVEINYRNNEKTNSPWSGVVFDGQNNLLEDSMIRGYGSEGNHSASDILLYGETLQQISVLIKNTSLLDERPIIFGFPKNIDSYIEIHGYDAPNGFKNDYPENFILKRIDYNLYKEGEKDSFTDLNFLAVVEPLDLPKKTSNKISDKINLPTKLEKSESKLFKSFKSDAIRWKDNVITNEQFDAKIKILLNSNIIKILNLNLDTLEGYEFSPPLWFKTIVDFWQDELITDMEFRNALEYVLQFNIQENRSYS